MTKIGIQLRIKVGWGAGKCRTGDLLVLQSFSTFNLFQPLAFNLSLLIGAIPDGEWSRVNTCHSFIYVID